MIRKYALLEPSEFQGEWYLPDVGEQRRRIGGTLRWGERADLSLHDTFQPMIGNIFSDEVTSYESIYGETTTGHRVSILNAVRSGVNLAFGSAGMVQPERIVSSFVAIGAHIDPSTLYREMRFRVPGLEAWIGRGHPQQTLISKTDSTAAGVEYKIYGIPEELSPIPAQSMSLGWGIDRSFSGDLVSDISVKTSACIRIEANTPKDVDWFLSQFGKVKVLLSMLCGCSMAADHITAKVAESGQEVQLLIALRDPDTCKFKNQNKFFMLRNSMGVELRDVFERWFGLYDRVAMPSQLALSVMASEKLWLHVEFLSLMQALEGFHRAIDAGFYASEVDYEKIRQSLCGAIPADIPQDHRDALKARIKYGNEISLRKRLDMLVARLSLGIRKQILGRDGSVPSSWVHTRNYYTHWDQASKDGVLDGMEMHQAGVRMRILLRALYLDFVGIPQESIALALNNACDESQYLLQLNAKIHRQQNPGSKAGLIMSITPGTDPDSDTGTEGV